MVGNARMAARDKAKKIPNERNNHLKNFDFLGVGQQDLEGQHVIIIPHRINGSR
jgi:hypothetical protein